MDYTIESIEHNGHTINIYQDESPESPREWGTLGIIAYAHKNYKLGEEDATKGEYADCSSWEEVKHVIEKKGGLFITPIYMYEHSGITISTKPFGDVWDSGQVGYIYTTKEKMNEAKEMIDAMVRQSEKEKQNKIKNQIKHHAPLSVRG